MLTRTYEVRPDGCRMNVHEFATRRSLDGAWTQPAGKPWESPSTSANTNQTRTSVSRSGLPHSAIIPKLAIRRGWSSLDAGLSVSIDSLVFNEDERGPADDQLRLHLEALNQLDDDEKATVVNLIESILLRHQARRLARSS
jgi:hypothetical protein